MSDQHIEPELTVGEIIKLYLSHWRMFALFTAGLFAVAVLVYVVKIPFVASSTIVINDSQNSSLQAFSNQFFGLSKSVQESKKGSSLLSKHIEYLKTREFYEALLQRIQVRGNSPLITMEERNGYDILKTNYLGDLDKPEKRVQVLQRLDSWTKINIDSDFEIRVSAVTPIKAMSLFLSNSASELAAEILKKREMNEIARVEDFMAKQKVDADQKLVQLSKQLAEMQNKEGALLPLASKDKMGDYISDLLVRSNEIKLKMAENNKMIEYLQRGRSSQRESALYGVGGKIEALRIENSILQTKLGQVQSSIDRLKRDAKELPFAAQMVDDLKKKSELEFARYKELTTNLAKLEAQKLSIDTRFEVLERARWENTLPQIGLLSLGLLSLLLSQFVGSLVIYFKYLWNPHVVTAQASRNLVIFDNHSADPRVIIENSKIKFSLKKPEPKPEEADKPEDPQKIAWNVVNVGQGTDVSQ
ncbi:hypothetical protein AZI87_03865 [Bdellovibrio bacteriovorus]|uniref:Polysaccharide chain length determinant N-terminal domain-containing protein n=1 Tax=Bdellovibrio bacteriovorus TaxID=959 RepID=A0A161PU46_BDEBC|nr:hypothetical protein [Bdellovibrio bacteriovorus]KYG68396.1 hypothetical protein AZI87_03865 [Bdellovibrio bacteriovorus]